MATVGNAFDLFGSAYWPDDFVGLTGRQVIVWKQVVFFLIVVPGLVAWVLHLRKLAGRRPLDDQALLLTSLVTGVIVLAALSMGEPRYRILFDGAHPPGGLAADPFILDGSGGRAIGPGEPGRLVPAPPAAGVTVLVLATGSIVGTAHPAVGLAQRLRGPSHLFRRTPPIGARWPTWPGPPWPAIAGTSLATTCSVASRTAVRCG